MPLISGLITILIKVNAKVNPYGLALLVYVNLKGGLPRPQEKEKDILKKVGHNAYG